MGFEPTTSSLGIVTSTDAEKQKGSWLITVYGQRAPLASRSKPSHFHANYRSTGGPKQYKTVREVGRCKPQDDGSCERPGRHQNAFSRPPASPSGPRASLRLPSPLWAARGLPGPSLFRAVCLATRPHPVGPWSRCPGRTGVSWAGVTPILGLRTSVPGSTRGNRLENPRTAVLDRAACAGVSTAVADARV